MKLPGLVTIVSSSVSAALLLVSPITTFAGSDQSYVSHESVTRGSLLHGGIVETGSSQHADLSRYSATHRLPIAHERNVPPNNYILREADIPERNWEPGHRGVDLKAQPGDPIYASRGGIVYFAGEVAGTPVVSILHSDGLRTTYEPVTRTVSINQRVSRGQLIGHLADTTALPETARAEPGLSWGARDGDTYVNPMLLLGIPTIRLKSHNPVQQAHSA